MRIRLLDRFRAPLLALAVLALGFAIACEDDDDANGVDGDTTPTVTTPAGDGTPAATPAIDGTPAATPAGGGQGTPTPSAGAAAGDTQYGSALSLLLQEDEEIGQDAGDLVDEWNIDVLPDGTGLPEGSGTAAEGAEIYATECAACHGPNGEGGIGPRLVSDEPGAWEPGDQVTIGSWWPYATTVYDYIRRAMPFYEPGTLSDDEVYALTAFLLAENEIIESDEEMNQDTLPQVEMPARDLYNPCWPDECYADYEAEDGATPTPTGTGTPGAATGTPEATGTPAGGAASPSPTP